MRLPSRNKRPNDRSRRRAPWRPMVTVVVLLGLLAAPVSQAVLPHASQAAKRRAAKVGGLRTPSLQSPSSGTRVQALPTFSWATVPRATAYQFELSADPRFGSVVGNQSGKGTIETANTAATIDKAVPDGPYYWRVRAVGANHSSSRWSSARKLVKAWSTAPQPIGPNGVSIAWPAQPLVFTWSSVPYAVKYQITVATDNKLANQVLGTKLSPITTPGTVYAPSLPLDAGITYFWVVTPIDAQGHVGTPSPMASFTYQWPSRTSTEVSDLNPNPRVFDPLFKWAPIAGAVRYEVEVNSAEDFPAGSKWCCTGATIGTAMAPTKVLRNDRYYWRLRGIDAKGHAGDWNNGTPFTKAFDSVTPSIPELTVRDASGKAAEPGEVPETTTPIVTWDPVPGASEYQVQVAPYEAGSPEKCKWSIVAKYPRIYQAETASTAWTPLGYASGSNAHIGPPAWPHAQQTPPFALPPGNHYCVQVLARSDDDARNSQVISSWTQINGAGKPAFNYTEAAGSAPESLFVTTSGANLQPRSGTKYRVTPLFTWNSIAGARGYYVVVARDENFTNVVDVGYTNVTAYAPRLGNEMPLSDETTAYYWTVIPALNENGSGISNYPPCTPELAESEGSEECNVVQSFDKESVAPRPSSPAPGSTIDTQPTFEWTSAENARRYRVQVSQDPTFANPLEDVTTDATAYTSSTTYPAYTKLYWRVRANDWTGQGLSWSAAQTFVRTLPRPKSAVATQTSGEAIPTLDWSLVEGATGYEVQVNRVNGTGLNLNFPAAAGTPMEWYGVGAWHWRVRALFPGPTPTATVAGPYSEQQQQFLRTLAAPSGARGVKAGARTLISWSPDPQAKQYEVDISTSEAFTSRIESHRTDNTSWAPPLKLTTSQNRGPLFWRVAAIDAGGNIGSFANGTLVRAPTTCASSHTGKKGKKKQAKHAPACPKRGKSKKHR